MLLTVEGGGFFSASASGYCNFLSLIVLGQGSKERPMRVLPWNQSQLAEQDSKLKSQLAPKKKGVSHRCPLFICFRRSSGRLDGALPPKVGPIQLECLPDSSVSEIERDSTTSNVNDENVKKILPRSSLKKLPSESSVVVDRGEDAAESLGEGSVITGNTGGRKIRWTDTCGGELAEIREFEPSDEDMSDEEFERKGFKSCLCVIQ